MKHLYLLIICCACAIAVSAQYTKHIIILTDKQGTPHSIADPSTYLSAKSIDRRSIQHIAIDSTDLPLSPAYLSAISAVPNVQIYNSSKWLNQVLIRTNDPSAITTISSFPFVKATKQIADNAVPKKIISKLNQNIFNPEKPVFYGVKKSGQTKVASGTHGSTGVQGTTGVEATSGIQGATGVRGTAGIRGTTDIQALNYGNTYNQIHIHEGEFLHNKSYTGDNIQMAMMDAGFNSYLTNPAFDSVRMQGRILGTWDYVANEASVNEDHSHGALCFSTMAANTPGLIVGTAPHAKYWLFRTEDDASETPVEEQNWIAAAEFADSAGVQMFSTSLGYYAFDNPALSYTHAQRDGNTAMITRAADLAARKGILLTVSAGNSGYAAGDDKFVSVPADADSVLAIGAVDVYGNLAGFSSVGPNGAGKTKPNIVSVGAGTRFAWLDGSVTSGNGTSLSNPNIAGLIACLWQAFPENSNMQIINAVQSSSDRFSNPDNFYGNGIPNFRKAYNFLMATSLTSNFSYNKGVLSLNWRMKADTSVSFLIERKLPGSNQFEKVDSIHNNKSVLAFDDYLLNDSLRSTTKGTYTYRFRIVIGSDTAFTASEYSFENAWPAIVADSLKLASTFSSCSTTLTWSMPEDAMVTYKLERLIPGMSSYATIATINGQDSYSGATLKTHTYNDPVVVPVTGVFNYRLQVMLGSDTSFYSKVSSFTNNDPCYSRPGYFFTPSPFKNDILAIFNTPDAAAKMAVVIYDVAGRVVYRYDGTKPAGYHFIKVPAGNLNSGMYVASVFMNNKVVYRQKLIK